MTQVHKRDNPSCDNNEQEVNATEIQNKFIDSIGASEGAAAGTALAGPIGGLVGAAAGKAAGDSIERIIRHNSAGGKSNCAALCVNVTSSSQEHLRGRLRFSRTAAAILHGVRFLLATRGEQFSWTMR